MKYSVIFILSIIVQSSYSQTPAYFNYTTTDGMVGSTVFDIVQDSAGYMWFAANGGLSRFDGYEFVNYSTSDGLNSNSINSLAIGINNEIYAGNNSKGVNLIRNREVTSLTPHDRNIYSKNLLSTGENVYFYSDKEIALIENGVPRSIYGGPGSKVIPFVLYQLILTKRKSIIAITDRGLFSLKPDTLTRSSFRGLTDTVLFSASSYEDMIVLGGEGCIYINQYDPANSDYFMQKKIDLNYGKYAKVQKIFADSKNNIWFSFPNSGFYKMELNTEEIVDYKEKLGLENLQATNFFEDSEGNIWIGTFGSGVYCITNSIILNYSQADGLSNNNVYEIDMNRAGNILCGTYNGFNVLGKNGFSTIYSGPQRQDVDYIQKIKSYDGIAYVCASLNLQGNIILKKQLDDMDIQMINAPSIMKLDNSFYVGSWMNKVYITENLSTYTTSEKPLFLFGDSAYINKVNEIFADSRGNMWFGTSLGACMIKENKIFFFEKDDILSSDINVITEKDTNEVLFGGEKGIAVYSHINGEVRSYRKVSGFDLSSVSALSIDNSGKLWIGTNRGLFTMKNDSVQKVDLSTGLPASEVYSLLYDSSGNRMLIGTNSGLSMLDLGAFDGTSGIKLPFFVQEITAGDSVYSDFDNLEFEPSQNNVNVKYSAILYSSPKSVEYEYSISDNRQKTQSNVLKFQSLKHGTYTLQIRAKAPGKNWTEPVVLSFTIKPRFTETIWFPLVVFFAVITVVVMVSYRRIISIERREKEKREVNSKINELKHQALSSMMNPHFIFNSLNAVQHLVNSGKIEEANDYISNMARLIRKNLDYSDKSYINLQEEIEKLNLYLEIESLRFNNKFEYTVKIDDSVDPQRCEIPNMIIQPFVENAIWHGILPLKGPGKLEIFFILEDIYYRGAKYRFLTIKIRDNGIGISSEEKKDGHISKGLKLVEERLNLLGEEKDIHSPVILKDLGKDHTDLKGTEVTISLPPHLYRLF